MDLVYSAIAIINKSNVFLLYAFKDSSTPDDSTYFLVIFSLLSYLVCNSFNKRD